MAIKDYYGWIAFGIFALLALGLLYYLNAEDMSAFDVTKKENKSVIESKVNITPRWEKMPITYKFEDEAACREYESRRIRWAFDVIKNESNWVARFEEDNSSAQILIICNKTFPLAKPGYVTQGETRYRIVNGTIKDAEILFFNVGGASYTAGCLKYPDVEIHEILHALGFAHNAEDKMSIMYPEHILCSVDRFRIDSSILQEINETYG